MVSSSPFHDPLIPVGLEDFGILIEAFGSPIAHCLVEFRF